MFDQSGDSVFGSLIETDDRSQFERDPLAPCVRSNPMNRFKSFEGSSVNPLPGMRTNSIFNTIDNLRQLDSKAKKYPVLLNLSYKNNLDFDDSEDEIVGIFQFEREIALAMLYAQLVKELHVIHSHNVCNLSSYEKESGSIPNGIFTWSYEEFLSRREIKNTLWIDVLLKNYTPNCLEMIKMNVDLNEIIFFTIGLFGCLKKEQSITDYVNYLEIAHCFDRIFKLVENDYEANKYTFHLKVNKMLSNVMTRRDEAQHEYKNKLEEEIMNYEVYGPLEVRYQINYYGLQVKSAEEQCESAKKKAEEQVNHYNKLVSTEKYCMQCSLSAYFSQINKYRNDIKELNEKYETKLEEIENTISYRRSSMEKMREQRKFLTEQIQVFHEEIEQMEIRMANRKLMEQRRLQSELQKRMMKQSKKGKKRKVK